MLIFLLCITFCLPLMAGRFWLAVSGFPFLLRLYIICLQEGEAPLAIFALCSDLHLDARPAVAALLVESNVLLVAVKNDLVTAHALANSGKGVDNALAQFLALLVGVNADVLNVASKSSLVDELLLHNEGASGHNLALVTLNDDGVENAGRQLAVGTGGSPVFVELLEFWLGDLANFSEHGKNLENTFLVVLKLKRTDGIALLETSAGSFGNQFSVEHMISG